MDIVLTSADFEQGNIGSSGNATSSSRIRTVNYIKWDGIQGSATVTVTTTDGSAVQVDLLGYENDTTTSPLCDLYWYDSPKTFDTSAYTIRYFRLVLRYSNSSTLSVDKIASITITLNDYVWKIADGQLTNTEFIDMPIKSMSKPYPSALWRIENGKLTTGLLPTTIEKAMSKPYPAALWRIDSMANDGFPYNALQPDISVKSPGAFCHAEKLVKVSIPESVKKIGKEAFRYTALKKVRIAADCEYYDTSFPENCEISYYGGGGPYVMLEDKDGYALLDKTGAIITIRSD